MIAPRPAVSLVVPFVGSGDELAALAGRLAQIRTNPGDELIIADNRRTDPVSELDLDPVPGPHPIVLHPAGAFRTPGFARNRGVARATNPWIVFIDADTEPEPDLLDRYFTPLPAPGTAALAGAIIDTLPPPGGDGTPGIAARHAVARGHMDQAVTLRRTVPYAQSANFAVRRDAFVAVGGFDEHARAAEDADLCIRLAARGYGLEARPQAAVRHRARATLGGQLRQLARHGAGAAWCERRHRGSFPAPGLIRLLARLTHSARRALGAAVMGRREAAAFALLEIPEAIAFECGRLLPNRLSARHSRT